MIKAGLREVRMHFSKYVKLGVVVMERGGPVKVIKPLVQSAGPVKGIRLLEEQGVLKRPTRSAIPADAPVALKGRPMAEIISAEREERR